MVNDFDHFRANRVTSGPPTIFWPTYYFLNGGAPSRAMRKVRGRANTTPRGSKMGSHTRSGSRGGCDPRPALQQNLSGL